MHAGLYQQRHLAAAGYLGFGQRYLEATSSQAPSYFGNGGTIPSLSADTDKELQDGVLVQPRSHSFMDELLSLTGMSSLLPAPCRDRIQTPDRHKEASAR